MEPLSVISVLLQLATVAPQIDKVIVRRRKYKFTRSEIIEVYRAYNQPHKKGDVFIDFKKTRYNY